MISALVVDDATPRAALRTVDPADLPPGDVVVDVLHSSLNYKDALAITGRGKIIRGALPFVPGIDLVGRVVESSADAYRPGDLVIQTGWGLGEDRWGGYATRQRVRAEHLVPLPEGLTPRRAMLVGTAGFTAMLAVQALERYGITPERGEIVVTGASGGVGSFAVALLARAGFTPVASTGSPAAHEALRALGAARIVDRAELGAGPRRPLDSARWAGAVDAVGGATLAAIISQLDWHGAVAACGLAGGHALETTVFPFILRGAGLLGVDSNTSPHEERLAAWARLTSLLEDDDYDRIDAGSVGLDGLVEASERVLAGGVQGRLVVDTGVDDA